MWNYLDDQGLQTHTSNKSPTCITSVCLWDVPPFQVFIWSPWRMCGLEGNQCRCPDCGSAEHISLHGWAPLRVVATKGGAMRYLFLNQRMLCGNKAAHPENKEVSFNCAAPNVLSQLPDHVQSRLPCIWTTGWAFKFSLQCSVANTTCSCQLEALTKDSIRNCTMFIWLYGRHTTFEVAAPRMVKEYQLLGTQANCYCICFDYHLTNFCSDHNKTLAQHVLTWDPMHDYGTLFSARLYCRAIPYPYSNNDFESVQVNNRQGDCGRHAEGLNGGGLWLCRHLPKHSVSKHSDDLADVKGIYTTNQMFERLSYDNIFKMSVMSSFLWTNVFSFLNPPSYLLCYMLPFLIAVLGWEQEHADKKRFSTQTPSIHSRDFVNAAQELVYNPTPSHLMSNMWRVVSDSKVLDLCTRVFQVTPSSHVLANPEAHTHTTNAI